MALVVDIILVLLTVTSIALPHAEGRLRKYLPLISNVHENYKTTSICLLLPHKNYHSPEYTLAYVFTREFSRKGVETVVISYDETLELLDTYGKSETRPIMVVLLSAIEDIHDFGENVQNDKPPYPIWLLIFKGEVGTAICDYCQSPKENIFDLRFDKEVLVSCCENPVVKEWWIVRQNHTGMAIYGEQLRKNRFEVGIGRSLYARRNDLDGIDLRVAVVTISGYYWKTDGRMNGFFIAVLKELQSAIHFEIMPIRLPSEFKGRNSWEDFIEYVSSGDADLAVGEFSFSARRRDLVDFTLPFLEARVRLIIKKPNSSEVQWSAYLKVFTYPIWLTIILLIVLSTALLAVIEMRKGVHSFSHGFFMNYLQVWGIFCAQGLPEFPAETPLRITYCSTFVSALVVSAAYSGSLTSFATVSSSTLPFSTLEGLANDGSYDVIVVKNSVYHDMLSSPSSDDPVMGKVKSLLRPDKHLPETPEDAFNQVCTEKVVLFMSFTSLYLRSIKNIPCQLAHIDTRLNDKYGMILPLGSQYTGVFNYHIQRLQDSGMMNRLQLLYSPSQSKSETTSNEVSLRGVALIFAILAGGIIVALILLLCEKICEQLWESDRKRSKVNSEMVNTRKKFDIQKVMSSGYIP